MRLTDEQKKEMDQRHPKGAEWRREKPPTDATKQLKAQIRKKTRAAAAKPPKPAPTIAKKIAKTSAEKPPAAAKPIESAKKSANKPSAAPKKAVVAEFRIDSVDGLVPVER